MNQGRAWILVPTIIVLALVVLVLKACDKKKVKDVTNETLSPGESAAIIIEPNTGTVKVLTPRAGSGDGVWSPLLRGRNPQPTEVPGADVKSVDGARGIRIGITPGGKIVVTARTKGFIFEPGPAVTFSDRPRLGLDVQWAFVRRWGVNSGAVIGMDKSIRGYVAGSYMFHNKYFSNTEILVGMDTDKKFLIGTKVRF